MEVWRASRFPTGSPRAGFRSRSFPYPVEELCAFAPKFLTPAGTCTGTPESGSRAAALSSAPSPREGVKSVGQRPGA